MNTASKQNGTDAVSTISVVEGGWSISRGFKTVMGYMPAGSLVQNYSIPTYHNQDGYQRNEAKSRVNALAAALKSRDIEIPTSVLLSLRSDKGAAFVKDGKIYLQKLYGRHVHPFFVVDGQHRIAALKKLIEDEETHNEWKNFLLPFVCLVGASEVEEMRQFYLVNANAKPVPVDLAHELLLKQKKGGILGDSELRTKGAEIRSAELTILLNEKSEVWQGLIRRANASKGNSIIKFSSMVSALKKLESTKNGAYFECKTAKRKLVLLDAYWRGICLILPEAFDYPYGFVLQKGVGASVMNTLLLSVLEIAESEQADLEDPAVYASIISKSLLKLRATSEARGKFVQGLDFWRAGAEGAAKNFTAEGGKSQLVSLLSENLPQSGDPWTRDIAKFRKFDLTKDGEFPRLWWQ